MFLLSPTGGIHSYSKYRALWHFPSNWYFHTWYTKILPAIEVGKDIQGMLVRRRSVDQIPAGP